MNQRSIRLYGVILILTIIIVALTMGRKEKTVSDISVTPVATAKPTVTITPIPIENASVSPETEQLLHNLFTAYRTMHMELFHSGPDCGLHSYQPAESVSINGVDHYYKVLDERFPTMQSVISYMETICTPALAEELRNEYLHMDSALPFLAELNGELYSQAYSSSTTGYYYDFQFISLQHTGETTVTATYQSDGPALHTIETGTITFEFTEEGWRISSLDWGYQYQ